MDDPKHIGFHIGSLASMACNVVHSLPCALDDMIRIFSVRNLKNRSEDPACLFHKNKTPLADISNNEYILYFYKHCKLLSRDLDRNLSKRR